MWIQLNIDIVDFQRYQTSNIVRGMAAQMTERGNDSQTMVVSIMHLQNFIRS